MKMKKTVSFILVLVLAASLFTFLAGCDEEKTNTVLPSDTGVITQNNDIKEPFGISLVSSSQTFTETGSTAIDAVLVATVLPKEAENKAVDWSASWEDSSITESVSDYIALITETDGGNTVTVRCTKAFPSSIIVKATTRDYGYTATCKLTFVGKLWDIEVSSDSLDYLDGYYITVDNSYTFDIIFSNPLGPVGSAYKDVNVEVKGVGKVVLSYCEVYVQSNTKTWYDVNDRLVSIDLIKDKLISVSYTEGILTVKGLCHIEDYYASMERLDSGRTRAYTDAFRRYDGDCYFTIKLTEKKTGVSETIKIRYENAGVSINL